MWWLALGEQALPAGEHWLTPAEQARAAGLRFPKRRTEYLLRRLVVKHAVALRSGWPLDPPTLTRIDVRNDADGAPYVLVDGAALGVDVSITDRAGWAVCALGVRIGCDLELVEPRTASFAREYLTDGEQRLVGSRSAGDERDCVLNVVWSAKESALKALRTGLRRDTRRVEVTLADASGPGWRALTVRTVEAVWPGWWRHDGSFVLTMVAATAASPPVPIADPDALAGAVAQHTWLRRPSPG